MLEDRRVRYMCAGTGPAGATALGGISPFGGDGPALLLLGLFAVAGWWVFRRFGSGTGGFGATPEAEVEAEPVLTADIPELERIDEDEREPVLS